MAKKKSRSGLWLRGGVIWFCWTPPGGRRIRVSLKTGDWEKAAAEAKKIKANPMRVEGGGWKDETAAYIKAMISRKEFTLSSADSSKRFLDAASRRIKGAPGELSVESVQSFYDSLSQEGLRPAKKAKKGEKEKKSPGLTDYSRATYLARLSGFCDWLVDVRKLPENPCHRINKAKVRAVARERACTVEEMKRLIAECSRPDLKFVLYCGFRAGMRKQEICNAKPSWFDMKTGVLHIPAVESGFRSKNEKVRHLKLSEAFKNFLMDEFGLWEKQRYMLHPKAKGTRYRWDPRRPFDEYMESKGFSWVSMHTMRHSFCTAMAPTVPSIVLAAAVGDTVRTIEKHYNHAPETGVETEAAFDPEMQERLAGQKMTDAMMNAMMATGQIQPAPSSY